MFFFEGGGRFSNRFIFATQCLRPVRFQTINYVRYTVLLFKLCYIKGFHHQGVKYREIKIRVCGQKLNFFKPPIQILP